MKNNLSKKDMDFYHQAYVEAQKGLKEGGIPIGAVLAYDGKIIGKGHNQRIQKGSATLHGEMDALENAGRIPASLYARCTLYTTLSPCSMCTGLVLLYKIPRVIIGENQNFMGDEAYLKSKGVALQVIQNKETIQMMADFIKNNPTLWNEDIGEQD
jgi:cytosine/creatinine deaminase